ncbi:unnamed protein product [Rhizophagus irregularis]|nr:unnamed protein product [Rhizophagus irregularis]
MYILSGGVSGVEIFAEWSTGVCVLGGFVFYLLPYPSPTISVYHFELLNVWKVVFWVFRWSSMMLYMGGSIACLLCKPVSTSFCCSLMVGLVGNLERYSTMRGLEHRRLLLLGILLEQHDAMRWVGA